MLSDYALKVMLNSLYGKMSSRYFDSQLNVREWQWCLNNLDEFEFMIQSDGTLEARTGVGYDDEGKPDQVIGFTIPRGEYNPQADLRDEVEKWLKIQLEISVIDTI